MRRLVVLAALVLVNFPALHAALVQRDLSQHGRVVSGTVLDARRSGGANFVDYRLPRDIDPAATRFSAELEDRSFHEADRTGQLQVRVVPGTPGRNQPLGAVPEHLLVMVAVAADTVALLAVGLFVLARRREDDQAAD